MFLRHLLRRSSTPTIRFPIPISQRFFNTSISPANEDPGTNTDNQDSSPIPYPQVPLRTMTFSSAKETAAERRHGKLRIEPSLHALRRDPSSPSPKRDPNVPRPSSIPTPTPSQKRMILFKLKASSKPCEDLLREIEKDGGFQISKSDLKRWAMLFEKRGQIQKYLENGNIFTSLVITIPSGESGKGKKMVDVKGQGR